MVRILPADTKETSKYAKTLFRAYAQSLDFDLSFQGFDKEMATFPEQYAPPKGSLLLAMSDNQPVGCVGIRYFGKSIGEMKRLYVIPAFRGGQVGRQLAHAAITSAKSIGYKSIRLDTIASMENANQLYHSLGFKPIPPYRENPLEGAVYLELTF